MFESLPFILMHGRCCGFCRSDRELASDLDVLHVSKDLSMIIAMKEIGQDKKMRENSRFSHLF